jgi:hypothetical protein
MSTVSQEADNQKHSSLICIGHQNCFVLYFKYFLCSVQFLYLKLYIVTLIRLYTYIHTYIHTYITIPLIHQSAIMAFGHAKQDIQL